MWMMVCVWFVGDAVVMVCVVGYGGVWRRGVMGSVGMGGGDWGEESRCGVSV